MKRADIKFSGKYFNQNGLIARLLCPQAKKTSHVTPHMPHTPLQNPHLVDPVRNHFISE